MYELYKPFDLLSKDECQEIINYGRMHHTKKARMGSLTANILDEKKRKSRICWYNNKKYKKKILKVFKTFNKNISFSGDLQITFYKTNDFYDWHHDTIRTKKKYRFSFFREFERFLSISIELQPAPKAGLFLNSNLYPFIPRNKDLTITLKQGQAIVFPSKDMHMARNLGPEERISLVTWGYKLVK